MQELNSYLLEIVRIKEKQLSEIKNFFLKNANIEKIDVTEVEGNVVDTIFEGGVYLKEVYELNGDYFDFQYLSTDDLAEIIHIINSFIVDFKKTIKKK